MATKRLLLISAFYRNDKLYGLGFSMDEGYGDLDGIWKILTASFDAMWSDSVYNDETAQLTADLLGQLEALCAKKPHLSVKEQLLAVGNIYLLEKVGKLRSDDFNGIDLIFGTEL